MAAWGAPDSQRGSADGSRSSMSSHIPSGMTGLPSVLQGTHCHMPLHCVLLGGTVRDLLASRALRIDLSFLMTCKCPL